MKLVFATNNNHKLKEVRQLLPASVELWSLRDIDCDDDIPETGKTIKENAFQKARYINEKFGMNCFADDTGLEVEALLGRPGVYSARFAGPACRAEDNIEKLLTEMKGIENRKARFRTVISLFTGDKNYFFEGIIDGAISVMPEGTNGFGYDPVFCPDGSGKTFAQMEEHEKNSISHRALAVNQLIAFLAEG